MCHAQAGVAWKCDDEIQVVVREGRPHDERGAGHTADTAKPKASMPRAAWFQRNARCPWPLLLLLY